jgi:hypothetical protein
MTIKPESERLFSQPQGHFDFCEVILRIISEVEVESPFAPFKRKME